MSDTRPDFPPGLLTEWLSADAGYFVEAGRMLEAGESSFQCYEVWETPRFGRLFRLDGCFMSSEGDEFHYHENLIHVPGMAHPGLKRALVVGGGDGGSARQLLKHPGIEQVLIVELDEKVVELSRRFLHGVHQGAFDDPRVELRIGDGLRYATVDGPAAGARYDLIVLDLTGPEGLAEALYGEDFFRACRGLLAEDGALSLHLGAPFFQPERVAALVRRLRRVFASERPNFLHIPLYGSLWGLATASERLDPLTVDEAEIERRIAERRIGGLRHYNGAVHRAQFALPNHLRTLLA